LGFSAPGREARQTLPLHRTIVPENRGAARGRNETKKEADLPLYEHVVIARPDISGQQAEALLEEMKGILAEGGGQVHKTEYWGLKNLSYRIRKHRKGHYGLLNIEASHTAVAELERRMKIHDDVIRYITVKVEAHEAGPSAPLQRRDDRDRDDRGGGFGGGGGRFGDRDRGGRGGGGGRFGDRDRGDRGGGGGGFGDRDRGGGGDRGDRGPRREEGST
jgi:small subunit ribosomal protein S6